MIQRVQSLCANMCLIASDCVCIRSWFCKWFSSVNRGSISLQTKSISFTVESRRCIHACTSFKMQLQIRQVHIMKLLLIYRFSQVKKCSNEGRALMQLDFQQYRTKLERLTNIRYLFMLSTQLCHVVAFWLVRIETKNNMTSWSHKLLFHVL